MARKDIYHNHVIKALDKDQWDITDDPLRLRVGKKRLAMDLGAQSRLLVAQKEQRKIVVEVKSFIGRSIVKDLEQALGQYVLYQHVLLEKQIERDLYLAIPQRVYHSIFQSELGLILIKYGLIRLLVFDEVEEVIVTWVPA